MPSGFQNFDRFAWARSLHTTMPKLLREVEDTAKMTSTITMRYWSSGVENDHVVNSAEPAAGCGRLTTPKKYVMMVKPKQ